MFALFTKQRLMLAAALLPLSSGALAGTPSATVTYLPSSLVSATAVPAMSNSLLIVLGLLLAVIAFRTLKGRAGYQKALSVVLLGGGLVVGGMGVERTIATTSVYAGKGGCESGDTISFDANNPSDNRSVYFYNECKGPVTLVDIRVRCNPGWTYMPEAPEGTKVDAQSSAQLPWCQMPPPG